ncbi:hypothetical protein F2Q68_00019640 [Brassica cretica]|uniref:Uncharacterized protein n=1 Tax=Brassica cretica TaxID=69181 RepID=A0A8S9FPQ4_BRACR|nr:hypothetical protein F2Q68_00019640 [Brassica cretica]
MAATKIFFRSGFGNAGFSDLKDFWDDLPVSRLKYNELDDFQEVFQTTSRRLPGSLLDDFQEVFQTTFKKSSSITSGVQACICRGMIYKSFICGLSGAIKVEELSDHLVSRSECVEADGSFKFEVDFLEVFHEIFVEGF